MNIAPLNRLCQLITIQDVTNMVSGNWSSFDSVYQPMAESIKEKLNGDISPESVHNYSNLCVSQLVFDINSLPPPLRSSVREGADLQTPARNYFSKLTKVFETYETYSVYLGHCDYPPFR